MNYYRTNFSIVHIHKWGSFKDLDEMLPFERDVYKAMLVQHLKEEAERMKEEVERQKNMQSKINSSIRRGR
jgi:hypothetical protein